MLVVELLSNSEPVQSSTGLSANASSVTNKWWLVCQHMKLPAPLVALSAGARCSACLQSKCRLRWQSCRLCTWFASSFSSASLICMVQVYEGVGAIDNTSLVLGQPEPGRL
jgi:hypothetical protein